MSTHQQLLTKERDALAKARFEAAVERGLYLIYKAHPEIRACQANDDAIKKHFGVDDVAFEMEAMTPEAFDHDYGNPNSGLRNRLAMWSEQEKRDWLEKQIFELLPAMSPDAKENLHKQYQAKMPTGFGAFKDAEGKFLISTESMELKLKNLQTGKAHEDKSYKELVEEVAAQKRADGYPPLPSNATKFQIRCWDSATLKRMIHKYGLAQINEVLARPD